MQIINIDDAQYPQMLKKINNPPKKLYVEGDVTLLNKNLIAIIGSRDFTDYGEIQTKKFTKELIKCGLGIVSGMAMGIDTFAHMETIKNGGKTIAVLGSGFNNIYPKENKELFDLIIKSGGTVISEYSPNIKMQKRNFPLRNRIVSGLCMGVLVIEATYRSGTSITAKYAWKQQRKVFCIPKSLDSKNSCGTLNLLKSGAKLVTDSKEIISEFGKLDKKIELTTGIDTNIKKEISVNVNKYDDDTKKIIKIIEKNIEINSNLISEKLNLSISKVNSILSLLEIDEIITNIGGCNYKIIY